MIRDGFMKQNLFKFIAFIVFVLAISVCTNSSVLSDAYRSSGSQTVTGPSTSVPIDVRMRGIWLLGGSDGTNLVSEVDLYDPATGTWYPGITSLPTPRRFCGVAYAQGKIYVIGGMGADNINTAINEVFDISNHSWSTGVPLPVAMQGLEAVSIGNVIYCAGGSLVEDATGAHSRILRLNNNYGYWISLYDIGGANTTLRSDGAASVLDGVLYYGGGRDDQGSYYNTVYGHYVADYVGSFTATALPQQRFAHSAASYSSSSYKFIFFTGGIYANGRLNQPDNSTPTNLVTIYKPPLETQSMTAGTLMNQVRAYHASVVWRTNLYVFGGYNNMTVYDSFECLSGVNRTNAQVLSWVNGTGSMPRNRYGFKAITPDTNKGE